MRHTALKGLGFLGARRNGVTFAPPSPAPLPPSQIAPGLLYAGQFPGSSAGRASGC